MIPVATLRAAGLTDAQIVKVLEAAQNERIACRREQNRINKRNQRSRQHVSADLMTSDQGSQKHKQNQQPCQHVSADIDDSAHTILTSPSLPSSTEGLLERKKEVEVNVSARPRRKPRAVLPPDIPLSDAWRDFALGDGMAPESIPREFAQFCDHHWKLGNLMADWFAAWRTWCRNNKKWKNRASPPGGVVVSLKDQQNQAWENARQKLRDSIEREESGGPALRILPAIGGQRS